MPASTTKVLALFFYMVTVFQRCEWRGLTHYSNWSGHVMSERYQSFGWLGRERIEQQEPNGAFRVWAYPDDFIAKIDEAIDIAIELHRQKHQPKPVIEKRTKRPRIQR